MAPLLVHSPDLPSGVRAALREAFADSSLDVAARILYANSDVDCADARELVGIETDAGAAYDCSCG